MAIVKMPLFYLDVSLMSCCVSSGGSWRRAGEEKREDRREDRDGPKDRDGENDADGEKSTWSTEKDKENSRRTKNETDDDGWTTVRR